MSHSTEDPVRTDIVLHDVGIERARQFTKWGPQHHPDGTFDDVPSRNRRNMARAVCDRAAEKGRVTWAHILSEEVFEAFAEVDLVKLREELVQVAAVAAAWAEDIDSRA